MLAEKREWNEVEWGLNWEILQKCLDTSGSDSVEGKVNDAGKRKDN